MSANELEIVDVPERGRYEARRGERTVGFADYQRSGDVVVLPHTEVDPAVEGQGVGSALARTALDAIRESGATVDPKCPFIAAYIERHPQYADLVRSGQRS